MESGQPRRLDLDLLRAVVVLGLVPFHAARIFSFDAFYVSNDEKSVVLSAWVAFAVLWGMPLDWSQYAATLVFSLVALVLAYAFFMRTKSGFADVM